MSVLVSALEYEVRKRKGEQLAGVAENKRLIHQQRFFLYKLRTTNGQWDNLLFSCLGKGFNRNLRKPVDPGWEHF